MKRVLCFTMAGIALLSSCKKDEKKDSTSVATIATVADKKWQLTAHTYTYNGSTNDGMSMQPACVKDNFSIFKSDKTILIDEGATKCNSSDPQTKSGGNWELRSGGKELYLSGAEPVFGITELTLTILESTSTTLKVKYTTTVNGPVIENIATYTAM